MKALSEPQNFSAFHAGKLMLGESLSAQQIGSLADRYRQADFEAAPHDADVIPSGFVFRHFVDEYRQSSCWHVHSPRSNAERFPLGTYGTDSDKRINALTILLFDQRLSSLASASANDNWHPLEAA